MKIKNKNKNKRRRKREIENRTGVVKAKHENSELPLRPDNAREKLSHYLPHPLSLKECAKTAIRKKPNNKYPQTNAAENRAGGGTWGRGGDDPTENSD